MFTHINIKDSKQSAQIANYSNFVDKKIRISLGFQEKISPKPRFRTQKSQKSQVGERNSSIREFLHRKISDFDMIGEKSSKNVYLLYS